MTSKKAKTAWSQPEESRKTSIYHRPARSPTPEPLPKRKLVPCFCDECRGKSLDPRVEAAHSSRPRYEPRTLASTQLPFEDDMLLESDHFVEQSHSEYTFLPKINRKRMQKFKEFEEILSEDDYIQNALDMPDRRKTFHSLSHVRWYRLAPSSSCRYHYSFHSENSMDSSIELWFDDFYEISRDLLFQFTKSLAGSSLLRLQWTERIT